MMAESNVIINKKIMYRDKSIQKEKMVYVDNRIYNSKNPKKEIWNIIKEDINMAIPEWKWNLIDDTNQIDTTKIADYVNNYFISIEAELKNNTQFDILVSISFLNKYVKNSPDLNFE